MPLLEGYDDLDADELAIACASHQAEPAQLAAVRKLLARADAQVDDLECGSQDGRPDGPLGHNCSGKHAGMLAACRAHGWPLHPYRELPHPLQQRIAALVGDADVAVDGCGVPTFALPLSRMAALFATTPEPIAAAMREHPELVGGDGAADTDLMRALPGWIAKAAPRGSSARSRPTASAGRSRSRTARHARCVPRSDRCSASTSFRTVRRSQHARARP